MSAPGPALRRVVVAGSSGLVGTALCAALAATGTTVVRLVRGSAGGALDGTERVEWDPDAGRLDPAALAGADGVVNLAGAGIGDRRWSASRREVLRRSRVATTSLLAGAVAAGGEPRPVLVNASAVGFYGEGGDEELTETSPPGRGFLADLCRAWEAATEPAERAGGRVVHLRSGIVLSRRGGALARQLPLFRLGLGARLGDGRQWVSWITLDDEVAVIEHALGTPSVQGAVNAVAPVPVTNAAFTRALAGALRRPALLAAPKAALRLLAGRDLADEVLLVSQRVLPAALVDAGYAFAHPSLDEALASVLAGTR